MMFSARSFTDSASSRASAASDSGSAPRGRVPLIGSVTRVPSASTRRNRSGLLETTSASSPSAPAPVTPEPSSRTRAYSVNGAGFAATSRRYADHPSNLTSPNSSACSCVVKHTS